MHVNLHWLAAKVLVALNIFVPRDMCSFPSFCVNKSAWDDAKEKEEEAAEEVRKD